MADNNAKQTEPAASPQPKPTGPGPGSSDVIISPQAVMPVLQKMFGDEMNRLWSSLPPSYGMPAQPWMVASCPAWGDKYVNLLLDYTIPTMLAPENFKSISPCVLAIYTDPRNWPRIWDAIHTLQYHGILPLICLIPDYVLDILVKHGANKYWILGVVQNLGIRLAERLGAGYHMLMPDHLYGPRYFANLKRLHYEHAVIAQTGVSALIDTVRPELDVRRHPNGWLEIDDRVLGDMAVRHLHAQTRGYLMNDYEVPDRMPAGHYLCWRGRDALHSYCCHMNAVWIDYMRCVHTPNFIPATLDTRLPQISKNFYVPTIEDGMTFIEVSGADKASQVDAVPFRSFAARCWAQVGFSDAYMPYFNKVSLTPIREQTDFVEDDVIAAQHADIVERLLAVRPPAWMAELSQLGMG